MSASRHGYDPFAAPDSPSAKITDLQRQNDLLREANAVLKEALANIVDRYKQLAEKLPREQRPALADVYDESDSPSRARPLNDITTGVIREVVGRFSEPIQETSPSRDDSLRLTMQKMDRMLKVRHIIKGLSDPSPDRPAAGHEEVFENPDKIQHVNNKSLAGDSPLASPGRLGEERRILGAGSPSRTL
eukprot:GILI01050522.1.p1 GENE.GILI01050522.1~~GILI01050522.1.p1  ORF type:complete len:201 (+),score=24.86 GILI01050522.1:38-604(+)